MYNRRSHPSRKKKKKNRKRVAFPDFFWGEGVFIHRLYQYVLVVFLNCFFQQERFKWFLVTLNKEWSNFMKIRFNIFGTLTQSFVTNINWNQSKVLLGIVINLLWKCLEGSFSQVLKSKRVVRVRGISIYMNKSQQLIGWISSKLDRSQAQAELFMRRTKL